MFRTPHGTWILDDEEMYDFMILAIEAANQYKETGLADLSSRAESISQDIFDRLFEAGFFK